MKSLMMNVILSRPFDSRLRRSLRAGSDGEGSQRLRSFAPLRMTVALLGIFLAVPAFASVSVKRDEERRQTLNINIVNEPLSMAVRSLELYLPRKVEIFLSSDPRVVYRARQITPEDALRGIAGAAHVTLFEDHERYWIRDNSEPAVNLDVKDEDVRDVLKSLQRQCGIKNLIVDPQVQGKGTFFLRDVPCNTAFDVVLGTLRLKAVTYSSSVVAVEKRP